MLRIISLVLCAIESENQAEGHINLESSLLTFQINLKKYVVDATYPAAPEP
jgi:hypothetical protein